MLMHGPLKGSLGTVIRSRARKAEAGSIDVMLEMKTGTSEPPAWSLCLF
jgi:hypothetical protein